MKIKKENEKTALIVLLSLIGFSMGVSEGVEKVAAFVCPVIESPAVGEHNPVAEAIGEGGYTVVQGKSTHQMMVPILATNGDGTGTPAGPHLGPGDKGYTAVWAVQP